MEQEHANEGVTPEAEYVAPTIPVPEDTGQVKMRLMEVELSKHDHEYRLRKLECMPAAIAAVDARLVRLTKVLKNRDRWLVMKVVAAVGLTKFVEGNQLVDIIWGWMS